MIKHYDFDTVYERRDTFAHKWMQRPNGNAKDSVDLEPDSIPMWVADMDFAAPPEVLEAAKRRLDYPVFGYTAAPKALREAVVERVANLYGWEIQPDWLLFNPGMVLMLNVVAQAVGKPGDGILMNTPVYGPFLSVPPHRQRFAQQVEMRRVNDDAKTFHYEIDFDAFEAAITKQSSLYYLCDPHNPTGKVMSKTELEKIAEICLRHNITIAADAIHCDLLLGDSQHIPLVSVNPEIAKNTITMIAGTKTFNVPGMPCSVAIVPNEELRNKLNQWSWSSGYHVDILSFEMLLAAYTQGDEWLRQLRAYLTANRDFAVSFLHEHLPMMPTTIPQGTYLQWVDCSALKLPKEYDSAQAFFAKEAKVALSPGSHFGVSGQNYVRLNLGTQRAVLQEALERMKAAVERL
jgi:cysteine-S-conjugate beta-lyase